MTSAPKPISESHQPMMSPKAKTQALKATGSGHHECGL